MPVTIVCTKQSQNDRQEIANLGFMRISDSSFHTENSQNGVLMPSIAETFGVVVLHSTTTLVSRLSLLPHKTFMLSKSFQDLDFCHYYIASPLAGS